MGHKMLPVGSLVTHYERSSSHTGLSENPMANARCRSRLRGSNPFAVRFSRLAELLAARIRALQAFVHWLHESTFEA